MSSTNKAVYTTGSIGKHFFNNIIGSSIGLSSLFLADIINIFFISYASTIVAMASLGFGLTIMLFIKSLGVGMVMVIPVIIGQRIGAKDWVGVSNGLYSLLITGLVISIFAMALILPTLHLILRDLGARGDVLVKAYTYGWILIITLPVTILGFLVQRVLQTFGMIKAYSFNTFSVGILNIIFDYILIVHFHYGVVGAAISTLTSRTIVLIWAWAMVQKKYPLQFHLTQSIYYQQLKKILKYLIPSIITQLNMPVSISIVTYFIGMYGTDAMASWSVVSRFWPFMILISIAAIQGTGAIVGQNLGAKLFDRIKVTLFYCMALILANAFVMGIVLTFLMPTLADIFKIPISGMPIFSFYAHFQVPLSFTNLFVFLSTYMMMMFGKPLISAVLSWMSILSIIPIAFLLTPYFHILSVQLGYVCSMGFYAVIGLFLLLYIYRKVKIKTLKDQEPMMLDPLQTVLEKQEHHKLL